MEFNLRKNKTNTNLNKALRTEHHIQNVYY